MGGMFTSHDKGQWTDLFKQYQEKICELDSAVVGLFKALDVMDAAASSLGQELEADFDCKDQDKKESHLEQCRKLAARLLTTSKCTVDHQKKVTKHHLLSLLAFIKNAIIENAKSGDVTFKNLTIENFESDTELLNSQNPIDAPSLKIERLTDEIKSLRKKIKNLKEREATYVMEEKLQREKIQLLEQQDKDRTNDHRKEIEKLTTFNESLESQLLKANDDKKEVDRLEKTLQSVRTEHRDEISFYEKENGEMKERINSLKKEKEEIERIVREEKMQREKKQVEEQQTKDQLNDLRKEIEKKTTLNDSLQSQLQQSNSYKREIDTLQITLQSVQESLNLTIKSMQEEHQNNISKYKKDINEMQQREASLNKEKEEIRKQLGEEIMSVQDSLSSTLKSMQEENQSMSSKYKKKISEMKDKIDELNTEKEEIKRQLKEEKIQRETIQSAGQQAKDHSAALRKKIDKMTILKDELQSQLQQANTYKTDFETLTKKLQSMQDNLITTIKSMQEEHGNIISKYEKDISEIKQREESLNKENKEIRRQLGKEQILCEKIQLLEKQTINQSDGLRKQIDDIKAKNEEVLRQLEDAQHKNEGLNQTSKQLEDNLKESERKLEDISKKYQDLQQTYSNLEQENKNKEKRINELTENYTELSKRYMESKDSYEKYRRKYDKLKQNFEEQEKEMHELKTERVDILEQVQHLQQNVESEHNEKEMQLQLNEELNTSIKRFQDEIERLKINCMEEIDDKRKIQELYRNRESELEKKCKEIADQKLQNKLLVQEIDIQKKEYETFKSEKEEYIRNLHLENKKLSGTISTLNERISTEKESFQNLELDVKAKETENTRLSGQLKLMTDELKKVRTEYASMKKELELIKSKKTVPVQLYTQKPSEMTENVEKTIKDFLQKEFVSDRLELEFWKCSRISDFHPNYPLLVICVTVSRIGTDVANAIHGISLSPNMAVMVFHHKDEHALPNQLSERILTGKELKDIGGIFDMAYFPGKGIYPCEMNRNSADSLVTFIKRVAKNIYQ